MLICRVKLIIIFESFCAYRYLRSKFKQLNFEMYTPLSRLPMASGEQSIYLSILRFVVFRNIKVYPPAKWSNKNFFSLFLLLLLLRLSFLLNWAKLFCMFRCVDGDAHVRSGWRLESFVSWQFVFFCFIFPSVCCARCSPQWHRFVVALFNHLIH